MRAITIGQPHASLMVLRDPETNRPYKMFETRGWYTNYRGPLVITSARTKEYLYQFYHEPFTSVFRAHGITDLGTLPFGEVLAVGDLLEIYPAEEALKHPKMTDQERAFGDYSPDRYAWLFENIRLPIGKMPSVGKQGLWHWEKSKSQREILGRFYMSAEDLGARRSRLVRSTTSATEEVAR